VSVAQRLDLDGRYRVDELIGQGGMGRVFSGYDARLRRPVAIKAIRTGSAERLRDEARAMAMLHHPNVVDVFDVVVTDGTVYIVMERIDGSDLQRWLVAEPRRTASETIAVFVAAGRGLAAAHARGLVHRDFKPANVLRSRDGAIKVVDFGLALLEDSLATDEAQRPTVRDTGTILGTPKFMAPEQFTTEVADARVDQYAFCVALYHALWGRFPFEGELPETIYAAKRRDRVRAPAADADAAWVWPLLRRGLLADRERRWPAMDELLDALLAGDHRRRSRRRGQIAGAALVVGAAAVAVWQPSAAAVDGCDATRIRLATVDSEALASRFVDASLDDAVIGWRASLDAMTQQRRILGEALDAACATDAPRRRACIERRVDALVTAHALLRDGSPAVLGNAAEVVRAVSSSPPCHDAPATDAVPETLAAALERARLIEASGDYAAALAATSALVPQATNDPAARAAVALRLGSIHERLGDATAAAAHWREAYFHASAAGALPLAGEAAVQLVFVFGMRMGDLAEAQQWARNAEATIAREGLGERMRVQLARHLGTAMRAAGDGDGALAQHRLAVTQVEALEPADEELRAMCLEDLGSTLSSLGRFDEAFAMLGRAAQITDRTLPTRHPDRTIIELNLGVASKHAERFVEAELHLSRARALADELLPTSHPRRTAIAVALAELHRRAGDLGAAEALLREALAREAAARGSETRTTLTIRLGLAQIELARGRPEAALVAVAPLQRQLSAEAATSVEVELLHAEASAAAGHSAEADDAFARARALDEGLRLRIATRLAWLRHLAPRDRAATRAGLAEIRADLGELSAPPHTAVELALLELAVALPHDQARARERLQITAARLPDDPYSAELRRRAAAPTWQCDGTGGVDERCDR
jgi:tetratricopeptide (TPR) repeat protein